MVEHVYVSEAETLRAFWKAKLDQPLRFMEESGYRRQALLEALLDVVTELVEPAHE